MDDEKVYLKRRRKRKRKNTHIKERERERAFTAANNGSI